MSDGWNTVSGGGGKMVKLGDGDGQVREVVGVFKTTRAGMHGALFDFELAGGEEVTVPHNKALDDLNPETHQGKLVRLEYKGTKPLKGGKTFKNIQIDVYDGPVTPELAAKYPSLEVTVPEGEAKPDLPF